VVKRVEVGFWEPTLPLRRGLEYNSTRPEGRWKVVQVPAFCMSLLDPTCESSKDAFSNLEPDFLGFQPVVFGGWGDGRSSGVGKTFSLADSGRGQ
jgi:hypothetical protein